MARKKRIPIGLIVLIIIGVVGIGIYLMNRPPSEETFKKKTPEETVSPPPEERLPEEKLEGEVIDQFTADLKGTGQLQLITLIALPEGETGFLSKGILRIYADMNGQTLEWEASFVEGTTGIGELDVIDNPATGWKTIEASWGCGAHGTCVQFVHWTGSTFEEIKAIDENGEPIIGTFFGDAGGVSIMPDGTIEESYRNYNCPLDPEAVIIYIYKWNGSVYQLTEKKIGDCKEF